MEMKFVRFGKSLGTRVLGNELRSEIEKNIEMDQEVIFNLNDVDIVSNSFADECFGKLLLKFNMDIIKKKTRFINVNSVNKMIIIKALNDRAKMKVPV